MAKVAWLDGTEMRAWRGLLDAHARLMSRLDSDLRRTRGMSFGDYEVLVLLSEAPRRRLRMSELADRLNLSPSGLTRRLDGLVSSGSVTRQPCREDRRGSYAVLSASGARRLAECAPDHVRQVRHHFLNLLDRHEIEVLARAFDVVSVGPTEREEPTSRIRKP